MKINDRDMTVDYRVRCVVRNGGFDRIYYGITALEYVRNHNYDIEDLQILDVVDTFDSRGKCPGSGVEYAQPQRHFFTTAIGRHDEIRLIQGAIRR